MRAWLALALALTLALAACTDDPAPVRASPRPSFAAEAPGAGAGASVFLQGRPDVLVPHRVVVDVMARGAGELHGAAFRLAWDPAELELVSAERGALWSRNALALTKEGAPGHLAVAWAEKGEVSIDASREVVLGTLTFDVRGGKGATLAFRTERSRLVDRKGATLEATWRGGAVATR